MNRKLKTMGIALVAVLAMSVVAVSSASAANFTASAYPVNLSGAQPEGAGKHKFQVGSGTVECEGATFSGVGSGPSETQTITPSYTGCKAFGLNATVTMNGCDYLFNVAGNVSVECGAGKTITIDTAGNLCNAHIGAQSNLGGISYANNGNHVDVTANVTTVHAVVTGTIFCPVTSSTTTYNNGKYTGTVTLKGDGGATKIDVG